MFSDPMERFFSDCLDVVLGRKRQVGENEERKVNVDGEVRRLHKGGMSMEHIREKMEMKRGRVLDICKRCTECKKDKRGRMILGRSRSIVGGERKDGKRNR